MGAGRRFTDVFVYALGAHCCAADVVGGLDGSTLKCRGLCQNLLDWIFQGLDDAAHWGSAGLFSLRMTSAFCAGQEMNNGRKQKGLKRSWFWPRRGNLAFDTSHSLSLDSSAHLARGL